uniref:Secreted protein n=1 Tax=Anguilla anguilla TaxID=7936 RepID=A0A0E9X3C1_ANGAN
MVVVDFIFVRLLFCCRKSFCNLTNNQTSNWKVLLGTFFFLLQPTKRCNIIKCLLRTCSVEDCWQKNSIHFVFSKMKTLQS